MPETKGYAKENISVQDSMRRLTSHIDNVPLLYKKFSKEQLLNRPAPGKWSRQEILGHLIDSAINNLKRFTEIQFSPQPYQVISYNQNELVIINKYQELPLEHLLQLWQLLNKQIVYVVESIPSGKLSSPIYLPNDNKEEKTLEWIIIDYVVHMEHHLKQIE